MLPHKFVRSSSLSIVLAMGISASVSFAADRDPFVLATASNLLPSDGTQATVAPNTTRTVSSVGGYLLGFARLSGTFVKVNGADYASEARFLITGPNGQSTVVQFSGLPDSYSTEQNASLQLCLPLIGSNPAGTWTIRAFESFDDGGVGSVDKNWNSLSLVLTDDSPVPPSMVDLGEITPAGREIVRPVAPGEVAWYKFRTTVGTAGVSYFNIDTISTTAFGGGNDTQIGLFAENGNFIVSDDDSGGNGASLLSFGAGGANGELAPATYFLAVMGAPASYGNCWTAATNSLATGTIRISFTNNLGSSNGGQLRNIAGRVILADYLRDGANEPVAWSLLDSNGTVAYSGNISLFPSGVFSITRVIVPGTYTLRLKGSHWLSKATPNVNLTVNQSGITVMLNNGDADGDNEVGPGDFGLISSAYGSIPSDSNWIANADLDGDGEVGPADFGILSSNYGMSGN